MDILVRIWQAVQKEKPPIRYSAVGSFARAQERRHYFLGRGGLRPFGPAGMAI